MRVDDKRLDEISGMGKSTINPDVLWVHNDSGDDPRLFAVGPDGKTLGILNITNAKARDWEDMTTFRIEEKSFILIADVGDNGSVRNDVIIYILEEPDPAGFASSPTMDAEACAVLPFRYEDGPRDCEGVAVDTENRQILLISKRTEPPVLYTLPLTSSYDDDDPPFVAKRIAPIEGIVPPTPAERAIPGRLGQFRSQVTGFDISPNNRVAAVLTYGNLYIYHREGDERWTEALTRQPERVPIKSLPQSESVCFDGDADTILLTTEDDRPPVQRLRRQ